MKLCLFLYIIIILEIFQLVNSRLGFIFQHLKIIRNNIQNSNRLCSAT